MTTTRTIKTGLLAAVLGVCCAASASAKAPHNAAYHVSKDLCSVFTPKQIAREFHAPSNSEKAAARAMATKTYRPSFRRSAYEGCLAGFRSQR